MPFRLFPESVRCRVGSCRPQPDLPSARAGPGILPNMTPPKIVEAFLEVRRRHPKWGGKKILTIVSQVALDPFVSSLARHAVQLSDELGSLVHRRRLTPGHGAAPCGACERDTHCYPCLWTKVLPMCVDRTMVLANKQLVPTPSTTRRVPVASGVGSAQLNR